jgi:hypothetical protein
MKRVLPFSLITLLLAGVVVTIANFPKASAVSASDWVAGNIIDDTVFTDTSRLSVGQIQEFLNSKVPTCDNWGTKPSEFGGGTRAQYGAASGNPAPFTCLRDYYEVPKTSPGPGIPASNYGGAPIPSGARSAAQLIWDAAQKYNISPAVLLVKLGTESKGPLTNDDWPLKRQFTYAMGAHCPDSGPGGSANCDPNWGGFSLQIDEAASLMRWYLDGMDQSWWSYKKPYQNNYILWNVTQSGCGGSNVYLQNKATAALYTYTPYQPNQAALNNMYGTGDGCSAYGNRNFWRVYNDWFGSSTGSIIRTHEDGKMYVRGANNTYYYVVSGEQLTALGYGSKIKGFYNTSRAALNNMTFAGDLPSTVRFNNGSSLYAIDGGKKHYFDYATWNSYGQPAPGNLSAEFDQLLGDGGGMSSVVYNRGNFDLYSVEQGKRRYIGGPGVYQSGGYSAKPSKELTNYLFNALPKGAPILEPGTIAKASNTGALFVITQNGTKRQIEPNAAKSISIFPFHETSSILDLIPNDSAGQISLLVKNSQGDLFITDGTKKIHLNGTQLTNLGKTAADFVTVDTAYLNKFTTSSTSGELLIRINDSERVYKIQSGQMLHIQTGSDFSRLGYSSSNVATLSLNTAALLLTNPYRSILLEGTLFRPENSQTVYIFGSDNQSHAISTGYIFDSFAFSWNDVRVVTPATKAAYATGNNLSHVIQTPDTAWWLVSNGKRYWIPTDIRTHYTSPTKPVIQMPNSVLSNIAPMRNATRFIRVDNTATVYYMASGQKHALSPTSFNNLGGNQDSVVVISSYAAEHFPTGDPMY